MKKLLLAVVVFISCLGISQAQFNTDIEDVINPQNLLKEVVVGYTITIGFDAVNLDSLAKGVVVYDTSTSWIKENYLIYTKGIGDTTFIMQGSSTYTTRDSTTLSGWKDFINAQVVPAKAVSDTANYYLNGYKTDRKPFN